MRRTVSARLHFVGIGFSLTDVLLLVFTGGNRIVKGCFYFFRRTRGLEVDVQQRDTHVVRANGFFQFTLGITTDHGTAFRQDPVHGVFADDAA